MFQTNKYQANDPNFDEKHGVLHNKLGIVDPIELEHRENDALIFAYDHVASHYSDTHCFMLKDICDLHKLFLGDIFEWAGNYRRVDISSEKIHWCHALHIPTEMQNYEKRLARLTPFSLKLSREETLSRLAELHGELIAIHPFRDGNGRTVRLLCDLLLMQAGLAPIGLDAFKEQKTREEYLTAIRAVLNKVDYQPLVHLLDRLVA
ncbi:MAG: Fic family protein [Patescibacteria group bacterium]